MIDKQFIASIIATAHELMGVALGWILVSNNGPIYTDNARTLSTSRAIALNMKLSKAY